MTRDGYDCLGWRLPGSFFARRGVRMKSKVERIEPILCVSNMFVRVSYYVDVLGFVKMEWSGDAFACVTRDLCSLYLCCGAQGHIGAYVWVGVENVDAMHEQFKSRGATVLEAPTNYAWAREMRVADPGRNVLWIGTAAATPDPAERGRHLGL